MSAENLRQKIEGIEVLVHILQVGVFSTFYYPKVGALIEKLNEEQEKAKKELEQYEKQSAS